MHRFSGYILSQIFCKRDAGSID